MNKVFLGLTLLAGLTSAQNLVCDDIVGGINALEYGIDDAISRLGLLGTAFEFVKNVPIVQSIFVLPSQMCNGQKTFTQQSQIDAGVKFLVDVKAIVATLNAAQVEADLKTIVVTINSEFVSLSQALKRTVIVQANVGLIGRILQILENLLSVGVNTVTNSAGAVLGGGIGLGEIL